MRVHSADEAEITGGQEFFQRPLGCLLNMMITEVSHV
jgi:hypothetical protein